MNDMNYTTSGSINKASEEAPNTKKDDSSSEKTKKIFHVAIGGIVTTICGVALSFIGCPAMVIYGGYLTIFTLYVTTNHN